MLGSQQIDLTRTISGADINVPEVRSFGFAAFHKAIPTSDTWLAHKGPEIVYMIEGEACWELENEALIPASGGQFVLFPANKPHRIVNGLYPPSYSFWIVMSGPTTTAPTLMTEDGLRDFQEYLGCRGLTHECEPKGLDTIRDLARLMADDRIYSGSSILIAEIRAKLHSVLIDTWKAQDRRLGERRNSDLVGDFLERLHEDPLAEITIGELAGSLGYSRSYVHDRFRKEVGMSPNDYAQRLRIKRCCQRLVATQQSVTDIAFEFGFGSSQYFSRVFRKYLGATPSEYRMQMNAKGH